jgi:hypothetical protein
MEGNISAPKESVPDVFRTIEPKGLHKGGWRLPGISLPFCLFAFLLLFRLDAAPLYILDEVKNAQCAREMWQRGDPIVPTFNGELRADKPVLHYIFMMSSYTLFGFSPFAARLFSALSGLACLLTVYGFVKKRMDEKTATHVAWALILCTHWAFEFRLAVPDPYLIFFSTAGLLNGYAWIEGHGRAHLLFAFLSLALAVLSKGPVAIFIPGLILFTWSIMRNRLKTFRLADMSVAALIFASVVLPWYVAVHISTDGAWTREFLMKHNIGRFSKPLEGHDGFFALPALIFAIGMLPVSAMALEAYRIRTRLFSDPLLRFCLLTLSLHLLVFGISATKLPNYAMPAYPFAAIILGRCVFLRGQRGESGVPRHVERTLLTLLWLLPMAGCIALAYDSAVKDIRWAPLWLFTAPAAASILNLIRRSGIVMNKCTPLVAGWLVFNIVGLHFVYPYVYARNPVNLMAGMVRSASAVAAFGVYNPAFNIILDTPIRRFHSLDSLSDWLDANPGARVVSRQSASDTLGKIGLRVKGAQRDLFEKPTTVVLGR